MSSGAGEGRPRHAQSPQEELVAPRAAVGTLRRRARAGRDSPGGPAGDRMERTFPPGAIQATRAGADSRGRSLQAPRPIAGQRRRAKAVAPPLESRASAPRKEVGRGGPGPEVTSYAEVAAETQVSPGRVGLWTGRWFVRSVSLGRWGRPGPRDLGSRGGSSCLEAPAGLQLGTPSLPCCPAWPCHCHCHCHP